MAFQVGKGGIQSDINVTPLVDVVLVLLIIFMVITPLLTKSMPILVPEKSDEMVPPDQIQQQLVLHVASDGTIDLNGQPMTLDSLKEKLPALIKRTPQKVVFFEADDDAAYGNCVAAMDTAKGAGANTIGIMTPDEMAAAAGLPVAVPPPAMP